MKYIDQYELRYLRISLHGFELIKLEHNEKKTSDLLSGMFALQNYTQDTLKEVLGWYGLQESSAIASMAGQVEAVTDGVTHPAPVTNGCPQTGALVQCTSDATSPDGPLDLTHWQLRMDCEPQGLAGEQYLTLTDSYFCLQWFPVDTFIAGNQRSMSDTRTTSAPDFFFRICHRIIIINSVCCSHAIAMVSGPTSKSSKRPASDGGLCSGQLQNQTIASSLK